MPKSETTHYLGHHLGMKEKDGWEYAFRADSSGVVVLVPVTDAGELVLVEQYRAPVDSRVIELPAGLVGDAGDEHEGFEAAARRELLEETGFEAGSLEELLVAPVSPGMVSEIINVYLARDLRRVGAGGGDESEDITVHVVPLAEADAWLAARRADGLMVDHKIFAGLFWAAQRA